MIVTPIQTSAIRANEMTIETLLDTYLLSFSQHQILVVTSKIISLCEGRIADASLDRDTIVQQEADYYLDADNPYGFHITIKHNTMIASGGVDLSNGDGHYVLWPKDLQESANRIRTYLCTRFNLDAAGVIITDSHVLPLRWGTVGTCLAHSGFQALNSYIGKPDLFGRNLKVTYANISEGLAAAAVVCMGEGSESTPLAIIDDVPAVQFQDRAPTTEELEKLAISKEEDIFSPLLNAVEWKKGGH